MENNERILDRQKVQRKSGYKDRTIVRRLDATNKERERSGQSKASPVVVAAAATADC